VREPALGFETSLLNGSSFLKRIQENLASTWKLPWAPLPAAHAPLQLLDRRRANSLGASQLSSALLHACLGAALLWTVARPPLHPSLPPHGRDSGPLPPSVSPLERHQRPLVVRVDRGGRYAISVK